MNITYDMVQINAAYLLLQAEEYPNPDDFLTSLHWSVAELITTIDEDNGLWNHKAPGYVVLADVVRGSITINVLVDPSFRQMTCPVTEDVNDFSLI